MFRLQVVTEGRKYKTPHNIISQTEVGLHSFKEDGTIRGKKIFTKSLAGVVLLLYTHGQKRRNHTAGLGVGNAWQFTESSTLNPGAQMLSVWQ